MNREGGARIASLTLTDTQLLPAVVDGKATVLDLIATCADGSAVTIEIQLSVRPSYMQRIIYYLMVTGSRRLAKGQTYTDLRPLIAIHFLGENLLSEETSGGAYHSTFELRHHQTGQRLTNLLSVHLIELARFPLQAPCSTSEAKWLTFLLRGQTMTPLEISALNLQAIEEADERLRELSTDWNLRLALVQLEKVERDRYCYLLDAQKEALQKGRDEGLKAGRDEGLKAGRDEVDFNLQATNPKAKASEAHWAQPCVRVDKFTGVAPKKDTEEYLPYCFVFLHGKAERLPTQPWATLTRQEWQIFLLLGDEQATRLTNRALAQQLQMTEGTLKKHLQHIYRKLDVDNRASAALLSMRVKASFRTREPV